ncbi:MAG: peptide MFS transporter [Sphingomicrobium sp.]
MTAPETTYDGTGAIFGQPRGVYYLAFTEAWERFSYYGMTALVVLYMTQHLLLPGQIGEVAGMAQYRAALESLFGPLSTQALASQTFGYYSGLVYFTPMIGGWLADRWLGAKRAVIAGAVLMSAGHFAMAFEQSFLVALLLLILGSGLLKGNISAQVGHLYPAGEESQRTRGYAIFSMGINVGAVAGPLVCGLLAQLYGWHIGFGVAGVLMLVAMVTYLAGQRHLPDGRPARQDKESLPPLSAGERRRILLLVVVMAITVFHSIAYYQLFNVGLIWIEAHASLATPLGAIPTPWFNSIDAFFSVIAVPPLIALWRWQAARRREPGDIAKIGIGAGIMAGAALLMALAGWLAGDGRTSALLPFTAFAISGIAFLFYWPTLLALVSRAAPAKVNATMMGVAFLSLFVSNSLMGQVGGLYEGMTPAQFWLLDAAIAALGALIVLVFGRPLTRALAGN